MVDPWITWGAVAILSGILVYVLRLALSRLSTPYHDLEPDDSELVQPAGDTLPDELINAVLAQYGYQASIRVALDGALAQELDVPATGKIIDLLVRDAVSGQPVALIDLVEVDDLTTHHRSMADTSAAGGPLYLTAPPALLTDKGFIEGFLCGAIQTRQKPH